MMVGKTMSENQYCSSLSDALNLILLMVPEDNQNRLQSRSSQSLVDSSAAAAPPSPSSSTMSSHTSHKFDQQQPVCRGSKQGNHDTHKENERSKKHFSEQKHHHAQVQDEPSPPDPPECFTTQTLKRHSRKTSPNRPSNQIHPSKTRDRLNNSPLPHEWNMTMIPSHKTDRQFSQSARDHQDRSQIDIEGKTKNERSSRRRRQSRSHLGHRHPAKSSSFQSRPDQMIQVYKDLIKKQIDTNKKSCQDARIREEQSGDNSISEGGDTYTTDTSTSSKVTAADLERRITFADPSDDGSEEDACCSTADTTVKRGEESSSQSIGSFISSRSYPNALPKILKSPTCPPYVDHQLMMRQIKYLQQEPERNNASSTDCDDATHPSSQLIIYPKGWSKAAF